MKWYCLYCGKENKGRDNICFDCGKERYSQENKTNNKVLPENKFVLGLSIFFLFLSLTSFGNLFVSIPCWIFSYLCTRSLHNQGKNNNFVDIFFWAQTFIIITTFSFLIIVFISYLILFFQN